jgi:hypothetical protein
LERPGRLRPGVFTAAEMVGRLLERYALTMEEIDIREEPCVQVDIPINSKRRRPFDSCVVDIARFCDCKVWMSHGGSGLRHCFFGFETDTALAAYLYSVIGQSVASELAVFRGDLVRRHYRGVALRQASARFQHGMARRISVRLEEMHAEREAAVSAQRSTGTALMLVRHQVVDAAFQAKKLRLRSVPALRTRKDGAYRAGLDAGNRVNLSRPIGRAPAGRLS